MQTTFRQTLAERWPQDTARNAALERFLARGLPGRKEEAWRYWQPTFSPAPALPPSTPAPDFSGWLPAQAVSLPQAPAFDARFAFDGLNLALADYQAVQLADAVQCVLHLSASSAHRRIRIDLPRGAQASLLLIQDGGAPLATEQLSLVLGSNSRLRLYRLQLAAAGSQRTARLEASLARDAALELWSLDAGNGAHRQDSVITLADTGARVSLQALQMVQHSIADNHLTIRHAAAHTSSRVQTRGLAAEKGLVIFNGRIEVASGAVKTDSDLQAAHLLLHPSAEVNAKPELEINADDVKCAHGSTVGQLDEAALFYLRSRGISAGQARKLLTTAFAQALLDSLPDETLRAYWHDLLSLRLAA